MRSKRQRASGGNAGGRRRWLRVAAAVLAPVSAGIAVPLVAARPAAAACPPPVSIAEQARLLGWGDNVYGHATGGSISFVVSPVQVSGLGDDVARATAGYYHSLAVTRSGAVWAWGHNIDGQLGDGTTTDRTSPVPVPGLSCVIRVAVTYHASFALRGDGTVWSWGKNKRGQLGDGTVIARNAPVQVANITAGTQIAAGERNGYVLSPDGIVDSWGDNSSGQLGFGNRDLASATMPGRVAGLSGITQISGGGFHALALRSDGTVAAWGRDTDGQLGDGAPVAEQDAPVTVSGLSGITQVAAGFDFSLALRSNGTLMSWGANFDGELGDGSVQGRSLAAPVPGLGNIRFVATGGISETAFAVRVIPPVAAPAPPPPSPSPTPRPTRTPCPPTDGLSGQPQPQFCPVG